MKLLFDRYAVSKSGVIFANDKILKPYDNANRNGTKYKRLKLIINGKRKALYVHRIIAACYLGLDLDSKFVVDHIDGDTSNNALDNLMVMTKEENDAKRVIVKYGKNSKTVTYKK